MGMLKNPDPDVQISVQSLLYTLALSGIRLGPDALGMQGNQVRRNVHSVDIVNEQLLELDHASPGILQARSMHRRDGKNMKLPIKQTLEDRDNHEGVDGTAMERLPQGKPRH